MKSATSTLSAMPLDADDARQLSRAAKNATTWTERRNALIKLTHAKGGGIREIARATDLSPASVHNILFGRKRSGSRDYI